LLFEETAFSSVLGGAQHEQDGNSFIQLRHFPTAAGGLEPVLCLLVFRVNCHAAMFFG